MKSLQRLRIYPSKLDSTNDHQRDLKLRSRKIFEVPVVDFHYFQWVGPMSFRVLAIDALTSRRSLLGSSRLCQVFVVFRSCWSELHLVRPESTSTGFEGAENCPVVSWRKCLEERRFLPLTILESGDESCLNCSSFESCRFRFESN